VPEIGLTPQALRRYRERLGVEVLALHSGLADGERAQAWLAARAGRAPVVIGTRSAIFTPLPNAGLIVVDEEHDGSYKQQDGLRYHARDLALWRGRALGVPVLLGSATPSLETLARVADGRCARLVLSERVGNARMPAVHVEDLRRRRLTEGLSPALIDAIAATVARGEQVLVFRNRRGYAPAWLCGACGHVATCPHCDRPLTVHREADELRCHHCDRQQRLPKACPECRTEDPVPVGVGTERLAEFLGGRFPEVPVLRIDRDSTRRKDSLATMLAEVERRPGAAILVGTQMLAKGHDLPNLTLAAIINVDGGLVSGDFRAPERLAQLLVQVAGRAGRAHKAGQVWLETHEPTHPVLRRLLDQGYAAFAATELAERREVALPPHAHWALLRAEALDAAAAEAYLDAAARMFGEVAGVGVRGPMPAPMPRRSGRARWQLLFEATERATLRAALRRTLPEWYALPEARRVRWSLDVDPIDLT
jgi:primosomal protein N' (replication factor Y)